MTTANRSTTAATETARTGGGHAGESIHAAAATAKAAGTGWNQTVAAGTSVGAAAICATRTRVGPDKQTATARTVSAGVAPHPAAAPASPAAVSAAPLPPLAWLLVRLTLVRVSAPLAGHQHLTAKTGAAAATIEAAATLRLAAAHREVLQRYGARVRNPQHWWRGSGRRHRR